MTVSFSDDFDRRLRVLLTAKTGKVIPPESKVTIETTASGNQDDSYGLDRGIEVRAIGAGVYAEVSYDEPGAWLRLLADLDALT